MRPSPPTLQIRAARAADAARVARCFLASRKLLLGIAPLHRTDEQVAQWVQDSLLPSTTVSIAGNVLSMSFTGTPTSNGT